MWDIREITKTVTLTSGSETAEVVIRRLSEGDKQDMLDELGGRFSPGHLRLSTLERAIVSWTLPVELSADAIRNLPSNVGSDLFEAVTDFNDGVDDSNPPT